MWAIYTLIDDVCTRHSTHGTLAAAGPVLESLLADGVIAWLEVRKVQWGN